VGALSNRLQFPGHLIQIASKIEAALLDHLQESLWAQVNLVHADLVASGSSLSLWSNDPVEISANSLSWDLLVKHVIDELFNNLVFESWELSENVSNELRDDLPLERGWQPIKEFSQLVEVALVLLLLEQFLGHLEHVLGLLLVIWSSSWSNQSRAEANFSANLIGFLSEFSPEQSEEGWSKAHCCSPAWISEALGQIRADAPHNHFNEFIVRFGKVVLDQ